LEERVTGLLIWKLWFEERVAHIIHLQALVGEESCQGYSFISSAWRRELPMLFI
jgi:hypothetical protein